ncbi:MAG: ABC transporter ATP-binding protein [Candidatus Saccharimonadia bacterium]
MEDVILRVNNLTKTYVIGNHKNATKAQKAIHKLHKRLESGGSEHDDELLRRAQQLFAEERYEDSYEAITGKHLKSRPKDRGVVVHALNGVDLAITKGELIAIMGPSGSGKSTLLNMLGLLDEPTSGSLFIGGLNITRIKRRDLPKVRSSQLGFVFQSFNLITTLTALENVMLPLRYAGLSKKRQRQMAKKALAQVGLADRFDHKPNELSGGQQQRVAIARSIVNHPSIILADELTGELDSKMTDEVMHLIHELNQQGQTFIIVTHNPEVARQCRSIVYMRDGKIEHVQSDVAHMPIRDQRIAPAGLHLLRL